MPDLEYSVNKKQFTTTTTTTTTTDEDTDADYSEYPLHSKTSRTNDSSNGNKVFTCLFCMRDFIKSQSLITHLYWHTNVSKQEALSDTSEDIPIISSGEESVYDLIHISGGKLVGNSPLK